MANESKKVLVTLSNDQAEELEERATQECHTLSNMVTYLVMTALRKEVNNES